MRKRQIFAVVVLVVAVAATYAACGGGDDEAPDDFDNGTAVSTAPPAATGDPATTPGPDDGSATAGPQATGGSIASDDHKGEGSSEAARELRSSIRSLSSLVEKLGAQVARAGASGSPDEEDEEWFENCCERQEEDIRDELRDIARGLVRLAAVYEEAGEDAGLAALARLGNGVANVDAALTVLSQLATSEGATAIVDDMRRDVAALAEAADGLPQR